MKSNIETSVGFLEEYKILDSIMRDMLETDAGVSAYITQMDGTPEAERKCVRGWDGAYARLKHVRDMRNGLAHDPEIKFDSDYVKQFDVKEVRKLQMEILKHEDPLSLVQAAREKRERKEREKKEASERRKTFWSGFASKVRAFFS